MHNTVLDPVWQSASLGFEVGGLIPGFPDWSSAGTGLSLMDMQRGACHINCKRLGGGKKPAVWPAASGCSESECWLRFKAINQDSLLSGRTTLSPWHCLPTHCVDVIKLTAVGTNTSQFIGTSRKLSLPAA